MSAPQQPRNPTRRRFLTTTGAAVGSLLSIPKAEAQTRGSNFDVVIIGGGLAGLTAGVNLVRAGFSPLILESRNRVGGRTVNIKVGPQVAVEGGGEWVGPTQTRILALAQSLGIGTFPQFTEGTVLYNYFGQIQAGTVPPVGAAALLEFNNATAQIDQLAGQIQMPNPWNMPGAAKLDSTTFADWLNANVSQIGARLLFELATPGFLGAPGQISMLYLLFYVRSAGGWTQLNSFEGGAQDSRFLGGSQLISLRLHQMLRFRVRLGTAVTAIVDHGKAGVTIQTSRGNFHGRKAVVAMMPAQAGQIHFTPALPPDRQALMQNWSGEGTIKTNIVYPTPFWRDQGHSGLVDAAVPPIFFTFDNSPPDGSLGVLGSFIDGLSPDPALRRRQVLDGLVPYFGQKALDPIGYHETDWNRDPWSRGCVSPIGVGIFSQYGASLRRPAGNIHWAGTETSDIWNGYMEGAVRSGERVAKEVGLLL